VRMVRTAVTVGAAAERAFHVFTQRCDEWWPRSYRLGKTDGRSEGRAPVCQQVPITF
jgi:hypothetical protein